MSKIRPAVKCHGGKFYLCHWIIEHFPPDYEKLTYIEPFCGAANTLMNKNIASEEGINDLDPSIVTMLRVIRDQCEDFLEKLKKVKYTQKTFDIAQEQKTITNDLDKAVNEFILRRMSRGGLKKSFAWSKRTRGGKPGDVNAWDTIIKLLPDIAKRLEKVYIFNKTAKWNNLEH